jgi:hypothetical protein
LWGYKDLTIKKSNKAIKLISKNVTPIAFLFFIKNQKASAINASARISKVSIIS